MSETGLCCVSTFIIGYRCETKNHHNRYFRCPLFEIWILHKILHSCISHHRLCEPHQLQVPGFEIKFCVNFAQFPQNKFQSPEWLRLVWEMQRREGIDVRNVLNGKKAWLKYYEWEYMVVWNLSLCMRFQHMLAIFWIKRKSYFST